jgi:hypothetical protein
MMKTIRSDAASRLAMASARDIARLNVRRK